MTEHKITIATNPKFKPISFILTIAAQLGIIGVGIIADSAAMQWAGFIALALLVIAVAAQDKNRSLTFEEARKKIDRLESESN